MIFFLCSWIAPIPHTIKSDILFCELNVRLILHDSIISLGGGNGKIVILQCPEISIKWHKIITSFVLNKGRKQISATQQMIKWPLTSQGHVLSPFTETPGLYNLCNSLGPLAFSCTAFFFFFFIKGCLLNNLKAKEINFSNIFFQKIMMTKPQESNQSCFSFVIFRSPW